MRVLRLARMMHRTDRTAASQPEQKERRVCPAEDPHVRGGQQAGPAQQPRRRRRNGQAFVGICVTNRHRRCSRTHDQGQQVRDRGGAEAHPAGQQGPAGRAQEPAEPHRRADERACACAAAGAEAAHLSCLTVDCSSTMTKPSECRRCRPRLTTAKSRLLRWRRNSSTRHTDSLPCAGLTWVQAIELNDLQASFDVMQKEVMSVHRDSSQSSADAGVVRKFREITVRAKNTEGSACHCLPRHA